MSLPLRAVGPLSAVTGLASVAALAREVAFAASYGATSLTDSLFIALTPFLLLASMLGTGAAGNIVIPVFAKYEGLQLDVTASATRLVRRWAVGCGICVAVAGPVILWLMILGRRIHQPGMEVWLGTAAVGIALATLWMAGFYSAVAHYRSRFTGPAIGDLANGVVGFLIVVVAAGAGGGPGWYGYAFVVGSAVNLYVSRRSARGGARDICESRRFPSTAQEQDVRREMRRRMRTVWSTSALGHLNFMAERAVAAILPVGTVSAVHYGRKLAATAAGVIGGSVITIAFPHAAQKYAAGKPLTSADRLKWIGLSSSLTGLASLTVLLVVLVWNPPIADWSLIRGGIVAFVPVALALSALQALQKMAFAEEAYGITVPVSACLAVASMVFIPLSAWLSPTVGSVALASGSAILLSTSVAYAMLAKRDAGKVMKEMEP